MKPLLATIFRIDDWILNIFQRFVDRCPPWIRIMPAILALFGLLASSSYVLVRLILYLFHLHETTWSDVVPAAICFLGTTILLVIASTLCEQPPRSRDWFREQGRALRYALLIVSVVTLTQGVWYSGVILLWWISACVMACYSMDSVRRQR